MKIAARYRIRPMTGNDISQVMDVERESFPASWPQTAYQRELTRNRLARYFVAVADDGPGQPADDQRLRSWLPFRRADSDDGELIVGLIGVWKMVDAAHVVTFAVRESFRRQGIGSLLIDRAFRVAVDEELPAITLEVRVSNTDAQGLYEKWGFRRAGIRKNYYSDNREDAVIMTTDHLESPVMRGVLEQRRLELVERGLGPI
ncbi:MAG TPA: ribosomal protein S18-alanine N-acetyltransferase [Dehalococcoidia bacterium]|nr:ribosomal protein S18-alanine N-acetyltransferase [Dehalococcoidia bacterium]